MTSQHLAGDRTAARAALDTWLRWKGAVLESQGRYMDALHRTDDPVLKKKFEELNAVRLQLAKLQMNRPADMKPGEYQQQIASLQKEKETLEADLSALSRDFALDKTAGRLDARKLAGLMPQDAAYLDIASIHIRDFKKRTWQDRHYLVFVLLPGKEPTVQLIDLGRSAAIDNHIKAYQQEMKRAIASGNPPQPAVLEREAKAVYTKVIGPIQEHLKGKKQLYISPDGNLNLIPFEVLMSPEGNYLMQERTINYLGAGRDIVRFQDTDAAGSAAVIIADPDYNLGLQAKDREAEALGVQTARLRGAISRDLTGVSFSRLRDTRREAQAIATLLNDRAKVSATVYQDKKALEEVLYAKQSPRILHVATHGYFLKPEDAGPRDGQRGLPGDTDKLPELKIENPMLRSGIALAGANASIREGRDDGLVSAEKVLGLRLKGTELVVLSACETGMGDVQAGEGVFGLKRAFILAGAKTMVMSLWSVPSRETTELMSEFYRLMAEGKPKAEALRQAKISMMQKNPNPFYWGAFVMTGKPD
jgi:CHAT domain-containing protein